MFYSKSFETLFITKSIDENQERQEENGGGYIQRDDMHNPEQLQEERYENQTKQTDDRDFFHADDIPLLDIISSASYFIV